MMQMSRMCYDNFTCIVGSLLISGGHVALRTLDLVSTLLNSRSRLVGLFFPPSDL